MAELTGLDYTNAIKIEFEKLQAENAQLKSQLAEAMELIELATNSIEKACCICKHRNNCKLDDCTNKWQWQHQDRYEKLKSEVGQNG